MKNQIIEFKEGLPSEISTIKYDKKVIQITNSLKFNLVSLFDIEKRQITLVMEITDENGMALIFKEFDNTCLDLEIIPQNFLVTVPFKEIIITDTGDYEVKIEDSISHILSAFTTVEIELVNSKYLKFILNIKTPEKQFTTAKKIALSELNQDEKIVEII